MFYWIGVFCTLLFVTKLIWAYVQNRVWSSLDLPSRYGKASYVLITGSTGGIGAAFANKFASLGFNIVLVSRNEKLLKEQSDQLQQEFKIKVAYFPMDFANNHSLKDFERLNE